MSGAALAEEDPFHISDYDCLRFREDGQCDEETGICAPGTDTTDCEPEFQNAIWYVRFVGELAILGVTSVACGCFVYYNVRARKAQRIIDAYDEVERAAAGLGPRYVDPAPRAQGLLDGDEDESRSDLIIDTEAMALQVSHRR